VNGARDKRRTGTWREIGYNDRREKLAAVGKKMWSTPNQKPEEIEAFLV